MLLAATAARELGSLAHDTGVGQLTLAARLTTTEPEAAGGLAAFLTCVRA